MKVMCTDRRSFNGLFSRTTRVSWYTRKLHYSRRAREEGVENEANWILLKIVWKVQQNALFPWLKFQKTNFSEWPLLIPDPTGDQTPNRLPVTNWAPPPLAIHFKHCFSDMFLNSHLCQGDHVVASVCLLVCLFTNRISRKFARRYCKNCLETSYNYRLLLWGNLLNFYGWSYSEWLKGSDLGFLLQYIAYCLFLLTSARWHLPTTYNPYGGAA